MVYFPKTILNKGRNIRLENPNEQYLEGTFRKIERPLFYSGFDGGMFA